MSDPDPEPVRPLGAGEVLRVVGPAFLVSTLVAVVGFVLIASHDMVVGVILVVLAAVGGLFVRLQMVLRAQRRPPR